MCKRGNLVWNQQRLTLPLVDQFIADLKDSVREAKVAPSGKGTMVAVYGMFCFCFTSIISPSPLPRVFFAAHLTVINLHLRSRKLERCWTRNGRPACIDFFGRSVQSLMARLIFRNRGSLLWLRFSCSCSTFFVWLLCLVLRFFLHAHKYHIWFNFGKHQHPVKI